MSFIGSHLLFGFFLICAAFASPFILVGVITYYRPKQTVRCVEKSFKWLAIVVAVLVALIILFAIIDAMTPMTLVIILLLAILFRQHRQRASHNLTPAPVDHHAEAMLDNMASLAYKVQELKDQVEQLQVQLAGVSVAALGGTSHPAVEGDYVWSSAYRDVLGLRREYDSLKRAPGAERLTADDKIRG
jgi:hypothetical protein